MANLIFHSRHFGKLAHFYGLLRSATVIFDFENVIFQEPEIDTNCGTLTGQITRMFTL